MHARINTDDIEKLQPFLAYEYVFRVNHAFVYCTKQNDSIEWRKGRERETEKWNPYGASAC